MDPFRAYLKVKIQDPHFETFKSLIPSFTDIVKDTEPDTLQFESFFNESKKEIIWIESYKDRAGFENHLANPALEALKQKMMPLQEKILDMYFMSQPSEATLAGLQQYGIEAHVLDPWPGTLRLTDAKREHDRIQNYVKLDLSDVEAFREISGKMEALAMQQPGILFHRSYQIDDKSVAVFEEYSDSPSFLAWVEKSSIFLEDLGKIMNNMTLEVYGTPSEACKEVCNAWGAVYCQNISGFTRFSD